MLNEEPKVVKLTPEQINDLEVSLDQNECTVENHTLAIKQIERSIASGTYLKQVNSQINTLKKDMERVKHNIIAIREQIKTGELR